MVFTILNSLRKSLFSYYLISRTSVVNTPFPVDRYPYYKYTILLGATRALAHIGIHFTHRVFGLSTALANFAGYRAWPQPSQRETVCYLARDTTAGPILFHRQLPPQMLLVDHLLRTSLFPLQHYVQRRGAILDALYRISEGFWFSPSELVMTSLLHFEEKVHRKGLARAESLPLLMPRLLSQVLEHLGFPKEPRLRSYPRIDLFTCQSPSFSNSRSRRRQ